MNKIYNNNEESRSKLLEDLKNLPKIKAPENFEFNLMTRIQNKSFETTSEKNTRFSLAKFLAPSAVVVMVVLLFFIFYPRSEQINDLRISQEKTITPTPVTQQEVKQVVPKDLAAITPATRVVSKQISQENQPAQVQQQAVPQQFKANRANLISNNQNAIALDDYISGDNSNERDLLRGSVVNSGNQIPQFDGFLVKQKTDPQTLKRYREVVDSLKKAQMKLDSLKKASNLP
jgi:hypothetical protein